MRHSPLPKPNQNSQRDLISFVVSAYDRPKALRACLATIGAQTEPYEVIVCCNSLQQEQIDMHREVCEEFAAFAQRFELPCEGARLLCTGRMGAQCCYSSAEMVIDRGHVHGDWLVFASDDSLYVGRFTEIMLRAARTHQWDLVYCDMDYDSPMPLSDYHYGLLKVTPQMGRIDKTGFMLRRQWFKKFPGKNPAGSWSMCDGRLIEELMEREIPHGHAGGILVVHQ